MKKGRDAALPLSAESVRRYFVDSLLSSHCSFLSSTGGLAGATFAPDWLIADDPELGATPACAKVGANAIASDKGKSVRYLMTDPKATVVEFGEPDLFATRQNRRKE